MVSFLDNLPYLNYLSLDGCSFKYLAKGGTLNRHNGVRVCASNLKELFISGVDFNDLDIVRCLLSLLRSTCSLESLEIRRVQFGNSIKKRRRAKIQSCPSNHSLCSTYLFLHSKTAGWIHRSV